MTRLPSFAIIVLGAVLIAILGVPRIGCGCSKAKTPRAQSDLTSITTAIKMFHQAVGRFPNSEEGLEPLVTQPADAWRWNGPYLDKIPTDPWGSPYIYIAPGKHNADYDLSSLGPDGLEGTADDITK